MIKMFENKKKTRSQVLKLKTVILKKAYKRTFMNIISFYAKNLIFKNN